jgi:F-type H+-transporting ATPase subunit epsilon
MSFQCTLVTPEQQLIDEPVTQAIIPAYDGQLGVLTDRAPLLAKIGIGPLRLDMPGGAKRYFLIEGGVAQMKDNKLIILTQVATPAEQLDAESARAEMAAATARQPTDAKSRQAKTDDLQRARAKQELLGR